MSKRSTPLYNQFYIDEGEGEPIVLLHGLFGNLSNWTSVVRHFSQSHRVIIPRLPIFEIPQHQANLEKLTVILDEFLDWHQLADVTLMGNSMGGHIALLYALRKPENVKKLILTGSSGLFENTLGKTFPRVKDYAFIREKVGYTFYNKEVVTKELVDEVYDTVQSIPKTLRLLGLARSAQQNNLSESIHRITQPTLLIWGLQDEITPPEVALLFHDLLPNSELKFIDHCGHVAMMEHPDLFNQHVETFLTT
ncbi:MAG: alpha/beta hydrolase [Azospira oryzae]|nr:MAG: alpha/beta hydrolase [Azospira oryzae]